MRGTKLKWRRVSECTCFNPPHLFNDDGGGEAEVLKYPILPPPPPRVKWSRGSDGAKVATGRPEEEGRTEWRKSKGSLARALEEGRKEG